jgi:hypothetical protein
MIERDRAARKAKSVGRKLKKKYPCQSGDCKRMSYPQDMWKVGSKFICAHCEPSQPEHLNRVRVYVPVPNADPDQAHDDFSGEGAHLSGDPATAEGADAVEAGAGDTRVPPGDAAVAG